MYLCLHVEIISYAALVTSFTKTISYNVREHIVRQMFSDLQLGVYYFQLWVWLVQFSYDWVAMY